MSSRRFVSLSLLRLLCAKDDDDGEVRASRMYMFALCAGCGRKALGSAK